MTASEGGRSAEMPPSRPDRDAPPSSVAHEAALLADLLAQRGSFISNLTRGAAAEWPSTTRPASSTTAREPFDGVPPGEDGAGVEDDSPGVPPPHECTCGGQSPQACRVCPVCQVIAFVQKVNPETIDRVADFAAFAATALRDLADARRETVTEPPPTTPSAGPPPGSGDAGPGDR